MSLQAALEALKRKDYRKARAYIEAQNPDQYEVHHFLIKGLAEMALADWTATESTFVAATKRFPSHVAFWLNRGIAEENLGKIDLAIASHEQGMRLGGTPPEIYGNLSNLYRQKKRFAEAVSMAHKALDAGAERSAAINTLGLALHAHGELEAAENVFARGREQFPQNLDILLNSANLAIDQHQFEAAWKFFKQARAAADSPLLRFNEATARLLTGDLKKGWSLFESRLELPGALRIRPECPRWNGQPLSGKRLLIIAEQGFGDVIQFCRFEPFLGDTHIGNTEIIWAVPGALKTLLKRSLKGSVVADHDLLPICDYYIPIMSLPFATQVWQAFASIPYLSPRAQSSIFPDRPRKKIGVTWRGSDSHQKNHERSISLSLLKPLIEKVDADFYALAVGKALDDISDLPLKRLPFPIKDFDDTAACVAQMDGVLTVDTALAHLAGALGISTIILLPFSCDWRWGLEEKTPWYPSAALKRQTADRKWEPVIRECEPLLIEIIAK